MSDNAKAFIILTPGFAKDETDTTCLPVLQDLARSFKRKFPLLKLIVLSFDYPYFQKEYKWFDCDVISFDGRNRGGLHKRLLWRRVRKQLEIIKKSNEVVGLLSMWLGTCALVGKRFADKHNLKHLIWLSGQDARIGNKYVSRVGPASNELIAVSDFISGEFEKNYNIRPIAVIPPGIDVNMFSNSSHEKDIDIAGAGSLIPLKRYEVFVQVIAELRKNIPDVKAVLIGDGPEKKRLQDMINSSGLGSNIILTGEQSHPDVVNWMQRTKLLLHPSSYEGFGIVCIEALASGAEVISFVQPMRARIENWHTVANKDEMTQKTIEILSQPGLNFKKVIPYKIEESVATMAKLFSI